MSKSPRSVMPAARGQQGAAGGGWCDVVTLTCAWSASGPTPRRPPRPRPVTLAPCLPTKAPQPPTGEAWLHEIKHDGFRRRAQGCQSGSALHGWTTR
jgi:hypothetical protein